MNLEKIIAYWTNGPYIHFAVPLTEEKWETFAYYCSNFGPPKFAVPEGWKMRKAPDLYNNGNTDRTNWQAVRQRVIDVITHSQYDGDWISIPKETRKGIL